MTNKELKKELIACINNANIEYYNSAYKNKIQLDEYLSVKKFVQIRGLYNFIVKHKELSSSDICELIYTSGVTFEFLSKVISLQEDMIDEMREHGLAYVCLAYRNNQALEQKRKQIAKREQTLGM